MHLTDKTDLSGHKMQLGMMAVYVNKFGVFWAKNGDSGLFFH